MRAAGPAVVVRSMAASYFTYTLGRDLYVPLTSRCNSLTLPQLRGPNFLLPVHVVAALCRVRDAERCPPSLSLSPKWNGWCSYLDTQDGYQKLPPPDGPAVAMLVPPTSLHEEGGVVVVEEEQRTPSVDDLFNEIQQQLSYVPSSLSGNNNPNTTDDMTIESIVLSGEGEPTLRWDDMLVLSKRIHDMVSTTTTTTNSSKVSIRLTTNGLIGDVRTPRRRLRPRGSSSSSSSDYDNIVDLPLMVQSMVDCGISRVSVGLITSDPQQYVDIVRPQLVITDDGVDGSSSPSSNINSAHDIVCKFIQEVARRDDLEVETTAIARDDVDRGRTEALSQSLGVVTPVRWRPYFP